MRPEKIWTPDISQLRQHVDDSNGTSTFLGSLGKGSRCPGEDTCVGGETTADEEEGGEVADGDREGSCGDDEPDDGDGHGDGDVPATLMDTVRVVGDGKGAEGGEEVGWRG